MAESPKQRVAVVRIARNDTYRAMTEAVGLLGGISQFVPPGSRVLIKPNFLAAPFEGGITHPEAVEAAVRLVKDASPSRIYIGEGSADCYTSQCFRLLGIYEIGSRWGAEVVDLNVEEGVKIPVAPDLGRDYVVVPRLATECDVILSLPAFKLWSTPMSLSLKNLFGLFPARYYGHNKSSRCFVDSRPDYLIAGEVGSEKAIHEPGLKETVAAINLAVPSHLTIIDAIEGFDGRRSAIRLDLVIAGRNPVATDAVALAMAGFAPEEQEVYNFARERGLGTNRLAEIEVLGERIEEVRFDLTALKGNVLELPLKDCLRCLTPQELGQIYAALVRFGLLHDKAGLSGGSAGERAIIQVLLDRMSRPDYFGAALARLGNQARDLMKVILAEGGTSGDIYALQRSFGDRPGGDDYVFFPAMRDLIRFGLAYVIGGMNRTYVVVPAGLPETFKGGKG